MTRMVCWLLSDLMLLAVFGFGKRRREKRTGILRCVYSAVQSFVLGDRIFYSYTKWFETSSRDCISPKRVNQLTQRSRQSKSAQVGADAGRPRSAPLASAARPDSELQNQLHAEERLVGNLSIALARVCIVGVTGLAPKIEIRADRVRESH